MGFVSTFPVPGSIGSIGGPGASLMTAGPQYPALNEMMAQRMAEPLATDTPSFSGQLAQGLTSLGPLMAIFGAANSAIGSFYSAQSQQNQLKMQAQNQRFAAQMARINQQQAEYAAQQAGYQGQLAFGKYSMGAGQQRASAQAALAARGIQAGKGSAAEIMASMDLTKEIDRLTMNAANVRQQEAMRMQAFNIGVGATMADISAANLQATAGTIYPGLSMGTSLLTSAADIGSTWARNKRIEELLGGVSTKRM